MIENDQMDELRFDALRNAMYHAWRRGFLDFFNRSLSFVVVIAGAAAVGDLGAKLGWANSIQWLAGIATLSGALQLVFNFGERARVHEFIQRRYYELLAGSVEKQNPGIPEICSWRACLYRLYSEEPMPMRALDALAYNAAVEALGRGKRIKVSRFQALFSQFLAFNRAEFPHYDLANSPIQRVVEPISPKVG
jgi:hypothetical protein